MNQRLCYCILLLSPLLDPVGKTTITVEYIYPQRTVGCFHTWIDWTCRSETRGCSPFSSIHLGLCERNNRTLMRNKTTKSGGLNLVSFKPWSVSFCSENTSDSATRTKSLDMCCLARGAKDHLSKWTAWSCKCMAVRQGVIAPLLQSFSQDFLHFSICVCRPTSRKCVDVPKCRFHLIAAPS